MRHALQLGARAVYAFVVRTEADHRRDYAGVSRIVSPIVSLLWPAYGVIWAWGFGLQERMPTRWFIFSVSILLWSAARQLKDENCPEGGGLPRVFNTVFRWLYAGMYTVGCLAFPWVMYFDNNRSVYWYGSLIFFAFTYGIFVHSYDVVIGNIFAYAFVFLVYGGIINGMDYSAIVIQAITQMVAVTCVTAFNNQRRVLAQKTEELEAANIALQAYDKQKDEFTARVAHELKTPVTVVLGMLEEIENEPCDADHAPSLSVAQAACRRMVRNLNELLTLERENLNTLRINPRRIVVSDFIAERRGDLEALSKVRQVPLVFTAEPNMVMWVDEEHLVTIVYNLVENAMKFSPTNGHAVSVWFFGKMRDNKGLSVVEVRDRGIGIAPEAIKMVFRKYFQEPTNMKNTGAGIGLHLVETLATAHGGGVEVESALGEGSVFRVWFPLQ